MISRVIYFDKDYNYLGSKVIDRKVRFMTDRSDSNNVMAVGRGAYRDGEFAEEPAMWFVAEGAGEPRFRLVPCRIDYDAIKGFLGSEVYLMTANTSSIRDLSRSLCMSMGMTDEQTIATISGSIFGRHRNTCGICGLDRRGPVGLEVYYGFDSTIDILKTVDRRLREYKEHRRILIRKIQHNKSRLELYDCAVKSVWHGNRKPFDEMLSIVRHAKAEEAHRYKQELHNTDYYITLLSHLRGFLFSNPWRFTPIKTVINE